MRRRYGPPSQRLTIRTAARDISGSTPTTWSCTATHGDSLGSTGREASTVSSGRRFQTRLTVEEVIGSDDQIAARYRLSGMQASDFYGAPSTGDATNLEGIAWLRFRDGQAVEVWQASGTLDVITRLTARAAEARMRPSASAEAAALRWDERHPEE